MAARDLRGQTASIVDSVGVVSENGIQVTTQYHVHI
jgi:hypothetical protein